jgi:Flp pilus assembly CpaF family ATPase
MSFDVILPFLRPIAHLLQDTTVTEMMVNPSRRVFVEREGLVEEVPDVAVDERNLRLCFPTARRRNGRT